jgi:hypothetical protein
MWLNLSQWDLQRIFIDSRRSEFRFLPNPAVPGCTSNDFLFVATETAYGQRARNEILIPPRTPIANGWNNP